MKYCPECGSEYKEGVSVCADCEGVELVTAEEMHRRGLPIVGEPDTRRFVKVGTAEDPLTAEQMVGALLHEHVTVYSRPQDTGTVDSITTGSTGPWWDILVPEAEASKAARVIEQVRREIEAGAEEAGRAAEEEALGSVL